jgi:hypothetical protein
VEKGRGEFAALERFDGDYRFGYAGFLLACPPHVSLNDVLQSGL